VTFSVGGHKLSFFGDTFYNSPPTLSELASGEAGVIAGVLYPEGYR
jgi:hypothetical protein